MYSPAKYFSPLDSKNSTIALGRLSPLVLVTGERRVGWLLRWWCGCVVLGRVDSDSLGAVVSLVNTNQTVG